MDRNYKKQIKYLKYVEKDLIHNLILFKNNQKILIIYIIPNIFPDINNVLNCIIGIYLDYKYKYNFQYKYEIIKSDFVFVLFELYFMKS